MCRDIAIQLRNISKRYKLYKNNLSKILDLFGLSLKKNYEEFWSLKNINLSIQRGEKVGIIGRNGAGKTTLLSLIAGRIKPSSGNIIVKGQVSALFTLGVGFHPEFSGRENIFSSLAFQGVTGKEAKRLANKIIEFSELEDFINQPVKTYSAGMYARLAFTVATAIEPEILIIDEILSAGDSYFTSKAISRMKELTSGGTTVLFVSHDLVSVQKICNRCIWIEKGKIKQDGKTLDVIKAYSADMRRRYEVNYLIKNNGLNIEINSKKLLFRFITSHNKAPKNKGFYVHRIKLFIKEKIFAEINVGDSRDNSPKENGYILTNEKINWSRSIKKNNKWCREFRDFSGEYVHAVGIFNINDTVNKSYIKFQIEYFDDFEDEILFEIYNSGKDCYERYAVIKSSHSKKWNKIVIYTNNDIVKTNNEIIKKKKDIYGSGELIITSFKILNKFYKEQYVFIINEKVIFRIYYKVIKKVYRPVFVVAIYKQDGTVISQFISKEKDYIIEDLFDKGYVDFEIDNLKIGAGEYIISIGIFHDIDLSNPIEQKVYCLHDRKYKFKIQQPFGVNVNLGLIYHDFKINYT